MKDLKCEIWKPIKYKGIDYSGIYEISNMGRLKSVRYGGKILNGVIDNRGYQRTTLSFKNIRNTVRFHCLVIYSFIGNRKEGQVIDHINSNKLDNRLCNLQIISHRANLSKERTIKSGLPCGVHLAKNRFRATIAILNKIKYLGRYKCQKKASKAYQIALARHLDGGELKDIFKAVDEYRVSIDLKPIKRR